uniref:Bifunctional inhibitor/plant lipid transfer protein/seed storage helical domain-containing protein n=2 Tax=Noccaea caerulescens TaxID=107243 RepID=A0A1J3GBK1_NOCCA
MLSCLYCSLLLAGRTTSFKRRTKGYEDFSYCAQSLRLNSPFNPPIPECCANLKLDKMYCLYEAVRPIFGERFDFFKLGQLSHACGDLKPYCGIYKIPGR